MEKVLFVIPPYFNVDHYGSDGHSNVLPPFTIPYGVLSLEAYLSQKCAGKTLVSVLDLNIELKKAIGKQSSAACKASFLELLKETVISFQPSIIGISALFNISFMYMEDLAGVAKAVREDSLIVAGGGLPSSASRETLELCPSIDAVCRGEGEIPLAALIDADDKWGLLDMHPSWITRRSMAGGKVAEHSFVQDLDEIPMFRYDLINLDNYNARSIDKRFSDGDKREMAIHTSRGCPFSCVFCANPALHGKAVRAMSVARVLDEVRAMKELHGMTVLLIEDDHFFFDKKRAKKILRGLSSLDIRIEFPNGIAVYAIDDEIAALLNKAGASTVALAVESGSDYVLRHLIGKPLKSCMIKEKVALLRKHGVQSHAFIVIGLPGEMPEHRQETVDMLLDVGFDWTHIFCAVPIFGSRLYDICIANGYIEQADFAEHVISKCVITAPGVDPVEIEKTAYEINLRLNFVNNFNLKTGNFDTAIKYFENVTNKYPDHAFGHYFLSKALEGIGELDSASNHLNSFRNIVCRDTFWLENADKFGIAVD